MNNRKKDKIDKKKLFLLYITSINKHFDVKIVITIILEVVNKYIFVKLHFWAQN